MTLTGHEAILAWSIRDGALDGCWSKEVHDARRQCQIRD
jgi:hypothetical protein